MAQALILPLAAINETASISLAAVVLTALSMTFAEWRSNRVAKVASDESRRTQALALTIDARAASQGEVNILLDLVKVLQEDSKRQTTRIEAAEARLLRCEDERDKLKNLLLKAAMDEKPKGGA